MKIDPAYKPQVIFLAVAAVVALLIAAPLIKAHLEYEWIDGHLRPDAKCEAAVTLSEAYNFYGLQEQRLYWLQQTQALCPRGPLESYRF